MRLLLCYVFIGGVTRDVIIEAKDKGVNFLIFKCEHYFFLSSRKQLEHGQSRDVKLIPAFLKTLYIQSAGDAEQIGDTGPRFYYK